MIEPFHLSENDRAQGLWLRLKAHLEERLDAKRKQNDSALSKMQTAALRGEIKALRDLIALGNDRPFVTGNEDQSP
jgi:hypothetical protein